MTTLIKNSLYVVFLLILSAICLHALEIQFNGDYYKYNVYTQDWDMYRSTEEAVLPLIEGSTSYIQNRSSLQSGATAHSEFLFVNGENWRTWHDTTTVRMIGLNIFETSATQKIDALNSSTATITTRLNNLDSSTATLLSFINSTAALSSEQNKSWVIASPTVAARLDALDTSTATITEQAKSFILYSPTATEINRSYVQYVSSAELRNKGLSLFETTSTLINQSWVIASPTIAARLDALNTSTAALTIAANSNQSWVLASSTVAARLDALNTSTAALTSSITTLQIATGTLAAQTTALALHAGNTNYVNLSASSQTKAGILAFNNKLGVRANDYSYGLNVGTTSGFGFRGMYDGYFYGQNIIANQPTGIGLQHGSFWGTALMSSASDYLILHAAGDASASNGGVEYLTTPNVFQIEYEYMFSAPVCGPNRIGIYWNSISNPNGLTSTLGGYTVFVGYDAQVAYMYQANNAVTSAALATTPEVWHKAKIKVNTLENSVDAYFDNVLAFSTRSTTPLANQYMGIMSQVACAPAENRIRNIKVLRGAGIAGYTEGSVLVADSSTTVTEDNANFYYDLANTHLAIGTNTATSRLDIVGGSITVRGANAGISVAGVDVMGAIASTYSYLAQGNATSYITISGSTQTKTGGLIVSGKMGVGALSPASAFQVSGGSISILQGSGVQGAGLQIGVTNFIVTQMATPACCARVGIGKSPTVTLDILQHAADLTGIRTTFPGSYGKTRGSSFLVGVDSGAAVLTGNRLGQLGFFGAESAVSTFHTGASISAFASESWNSSVGGTDLSFETNKIGAATKSEAMRINGDGNVGIGTSSPLSALHVASAAYFATTTGRVGIGTTNPAGLFQVGGATLTALSNGQVGLGTTAPVNPFARLEVAGAGLSIQDNATVNPSNWWILPQISNNTKLFRIYDYDNSVDRLTIDSSGNTGIGTYLPVARFQVAGGSLTVTNSGRIGIGTTNPKHAVDIRGDYIRSLYPEIKLDASTVDGAFIGRDLNTLRIGSNISRAGTIPNSGRTTAQMQFETDSGDSFITLLTSSGNNIAPTERMRIAKDGRIGVGTTSPSTLFHVVNGSITTSGTNSNVLVGGSIGVGTGTPTNLIHMYGYTPGIHIQNSSFTTTGNTWQITNVSPVYDINVGSKLSFAALGVAPAVTMSALTGANRVGINTQNPATTLEVAGDIKLNGTNTTGAGSALLGSNSPASTLSAPYTWIKFISADGSTVYIPAWK